MRVLEARREEAIEVPLEVALTEAYEVPPAGPYEMVEVEEYYFKTEALDGSPVTGVVRVIQSPYSWGLDLRSVTSDRRAVRAVSNSVPVEDAMGTLSSRFRDQLEAILRARGFLARSAPVYREHWVGRS